MHGKYRVIKFEFAVNNCKDSETLFNSWQRAVENVKKSKGVSINTVILPVFTDNGKSSAFLFSGSIKQQEIFVENIEEEGFYWMDWKNAIIEAASILRNEGFSVEEPLFYECPCV